MALYRRCEKEGVGISVMKAFCGGQLLDESKSPFHHALTEVQCIQYALDKPGVITVLPGIRHIKDLQGISAYEHASLEEKNYSIIGTWTLVNAIGHCDQRCPFHVNQSKRMKEMKEYFGE